MNNMNLPTNMYSLKQSEFHVIPGEPWVYWISAKVRKLFINSKNLGHILTPKQGLATGNNFRFVRYLWEIPIRNISRFMNSGNYEKKGRVWIPYMKGGGRRKWFGSQWFIVNWDKDGKEIKNFFKTNGRLASRPQNTDFYLLEGVTWSLVSSGSFSTRYLPQGFIFDVGGSCGFPKKDLLLGIMAIMNSQLMNYLLGLLNPTINFQIGDIKRIPFRSSNKNIRNKIDDLVSKSIHIQQIDVMHKENTFDFSSPIYFEKYSQQSKPSNLCLSDIELRINNNVYDLYEVDDKTRNLIENELNTIFYNDEEDLDLDINDKEADYFEEKEENSINWLSYAIGICLNRFQPGEKSALGSAIYYRSDLAIGSLPEPNEEEFNELVGIPSKFAYIDEEGGRHVFSQEVEQALQDLALPDGIAVFDENHPRDLPTLVHKALVLMLGEAQAQEVIQQAAGGDLRHFLEKDFFTQHHIQQYHKRPVYWPIQSSKRSYGFVLFHEKIDRNTFYKLQQPPYLPTKQRAVQLRLEDLSKKLLTVQGSARKPLEKEIEELHQLSEELMQFAKDLDAITKGGYEPQANWIDDGVILRMAPLWKVIPLWNSEPKKYWDRLAKGEYDWSQIAMHYWPERVKKACQKDKSFAIAHDHEEWYQGG